MGSKKAGRPPKLDGEKKEVVSLRLTPKDKMRIASLHEKGLSAGVEYLYQKFIFFQEMESKVKKRLEEVSEKFVQEFSLFTKLKNSSQGKNLGSVKKEILNSSHELLFLTELLEDQHAYLRSVLGQIQFNNLVNIWKVTGNNNYQRTEGSSLSRT